MAALVRRYPWVSTTLLVGVVGIVLALAGHQEAVRWLFTAYGVVVALWHSVGMVRAALHGRWGLDVLAVTAIVATVLVGEYVATLVIALMLTGGEALEDYAGRRATRELDALLRRAPQRAHLVDGDGAVRDVDVDSVRVGETLLVRPAEIVPVDGRLVTGSVEVDESSISGESLPVQKLAGDAVLSGSVNGAVAMQLTATATAQASQYQQIVALVAVAAQSRAPVVRLADRYAVPFTLFSLALAGAAWWLSGDPVRFAEVLVLATPCPLLIAAPVAFLGGMSRAARNNVIVKGGGVLERLSAARTVVFDKTGTLTSGHPSIVDVRPEPGFDAEGLLTAIGAAEAYSSHVLAAPIVAEARSRGLRLPTATQAEEVATNGVVAVVQGAQVVVGKPRFVAEYAPETRRAEIRPGELAVYAAIGGRFAGVLIARDRVRAEAAATLSALRALGIREIVMLTGDVSQTAEHVASELGITRMRAECLPADKVEEVQRITERPVIMVGDGVNDAPVLAAADVGIAMGAKGATAASESAGAVILVDDVERVARAVRIGRDTVNIALQSIWIGIALSVVLMVVAAFGVIPATAGAALQEVVDLVSILAALRAIGTRRDATQVAAGASTRPAVGTRAQ
ncbi:heavy metal translocating P-type ATPase [Rathayibacter sp. YIM 133350]|uniref:heavy metal translocating P-type ATPase n=1 Tax=Rathayibacter sp. YIM 133350 TaxID=3131992 RepID=UPI00307D4A53